MRARRLDVLQRAESEAGLDTLVTLVAVPLPD